MRATRLNHSKNFPSLYLPCFPNRCSSTIHYNKFRSMRPVQFKSQSRPQMSLIRVSQRMMISAWGDNPSRPCRVKLMVASHWEYHRLLKIAQRQQLLQCSWKDLRIRNMPMSNPRLLLSHDLIRLRLINNRSHNKCLLLNSSCLSRPLKRIIEQTLPSAKAIKIISCLILLAMSRARLVWQRTCNNSSNKWLGSLTHWGYLNKVAPILQI